MRKFRKFILPWMHFLTKLCLVTVLSGFSDVLFPSSRARLNLMPGPGFGSTPTRAFAGTCALRRRNLFLYLLKLCLASYTTDGHSAALLSLIVGHHRTDVRFLFMNFGSGLCGCFLLPQLRLQGSHLLGLRDKSCKHLGKF
jgi:hypothetical protein